MTLKSPQEKVINILTSSGRYALIDINDVDLVSEYKWNSFQTGKKSKSWRVCTTVRKNGTRKCLYMSRLIMGNPKGMMVDHINGDGLDNRKSNLRICTHAENNRNRKPDFGRKYKGVSKDSHSPKLWRAQISINNRRTFIGLFKTEVEAAIAYNTEAKKHHGKYARINELS